jgi:glycosyltransferase involved in cell wall biosynthesis
MNIAVNTRLLIPGKIEGLGRFTHETLSRITRAHPEHRFIFIFDRKFSDEFVYSENVVPVIANPPARHPVLWYLFFDWGVPPVLKKHKVDLFLSPDGWLSLRTDIPSLPVIHDINFFHNPEWIDWAPMKYYKHFFPRFVDKAVRIATVSQFSKKDIISQFKVSESKIDVVYNGCTEGFVPITDVQKAEIRKKYAKGEEFFLFVGLVHPRKNHARIIKAFDSFRAHSGSKVKLVIVGSTKYMSGEVHAAYDQSLFKNDILFTGYITDKELKQITASALALVYASLFEGFGIPILEAMQCDTPVITSNTSSMPEIGGDAVLYVDPYSTDSISSAMQKIYFDKPVRETLIEKARINRNRFSWDHTANLLWESMEKTLKIK